MTPRWFRRGGVTLAWHAAEGGGVPLVLQHGLCGSAAQVAEVLPDPLPGFRPMVLECRGHGGSEPGDCAALSLTTFAADLGALVESLGEPVVIGGISMGAALALRVALRHPALVRGLVLIRPAWGWEEGPPPNLEPNREVAALLTRLAPGAARAAFLHSPTAARLRVESPDNLASLLGFFGREPIELTAALLGAISCDTSGVGPTDLAALRVPALVVGTAEDAIHPLELARGIAARIPGAQMAEVLPKGVDRQRHLAALRAALGRFLVETVAEHVR